MTATDAIDYLESRGVSTEDVNAKMSDVFTSLVLERGPETLPAFAAYNTSCYLGLYVAAFGRDAAMALVEEVCDAVMGSPEAAVTKHLFNPTETN